MGRGLRELTNVVARNAHESVLVAKDLYRKVEEQGQRMVTMNTAISLTAPTGGAKPATTASLPAAGPAPPEPAARKDGPRSSDEHAKRGEYLQSAVHYAATVLVAHKVGAMRRGFSRWASYAYNTKLLQRRKITGDPAAKQPGGARASIRRTARWTGSGRASRRSASSPGDCMDLSRAILRASGQSRANGEGMEITSRQCQGLDSNARRHGCRQHDREGSNQGTKYQPSVSAQKQIQEDRRPR
jgi:hypothetical protein